MVTLNTTVGSSLCVISYQAGGNVISSFNQGILKGEVSLYG